MNDQIKTIEVLHQLEQNKLWQTEFNKFAGDGSEHVAGIIPLGRLGRLCVLGYLAGFTSEWILEQEVRICDGYGSFVGCGPDEPSPLGSEMTYSRRYYETRDESFLQRLAELLERSFYLSQWQWRDPAPAYLKKLEASAPVFVPRPAGAPHYWYRHSAKEQVRLCSGGCVFGVVQELAADEKEAYHTELEMELPVVCATRQNMVTERPAFPLGQVYGKYERYPLGPEDVEGGLRTRGIYKKDREELPLITYVTVVYNRRELLQRCMESVWAQSYRNIEYIVIDGGSTDGTLELIRENEDKIDYFISQKDTGVYNAMNKGVALASGHFLCFMNSDDTCTVNAAKSIVDEYHRTHAEMICGWIRLRKTDGSLTNHTHAGRFLIHNNIIRYPMLYHQALYASDKMFNTIGYLDEQYVIPSDNKWTTMAINTGYPVALIENVVAVFSLGGNSDEQKALLLEETLAIFSSFFPEIPQKLIEQIYLCMKRSPIGDRELIPLFKKLKPYFGNQKFKRLIFESSLYMCTDEFSYTYRGNRTPEKWFKRQMCKIDPTITFASDQPLFEVRDILAERRFPYIR